MDIYDKSGNELTALVVLTKEHGVYHRTAMKACQAKTLPAQKVAGAWHVVGGDFMAWLEKHRGERRGRPRGSNQILTKL